MARIVVITQYYQPDAPAWIPTGLARALADRGHEVRVLTTFPHYECGRVSHGYRQRRRFLERDGSILVRRVPLFPSHSGNPVARILNYVSVAASMRLARSFVQGADVAYVYATPMTVADPARVWSRSLRLPFVLHIQDLWPESVTGSGLLPTSVGRSMTVPLNRWLRAIYGRASSVIAIAPTMRDMLIARGVPESKVSTVMNWSNDADDADPQPIINNRGDLHLLYAGNLGRMQDVSTIVRAAAKLGDLEGLRITVAGSGVEESSLKSLATDLEVQNIEFVGRLSPLEMREFYQQADFQFVTLRDLPIFQGTIPSKLQAGLANGLPVITTVRGDVKRLVIERGVGLSAGPEDPASLASAIRRAYAMSGSERLALRQRARLLYESTMSKCGAIDVIEARLLAAIETRASQLGSSGR